MGLPRLGSGDPQVRSPRATMQQWGTLGLGSCTPTLSVTATTQVL
jgi:hypothetical protein